ncbi:MAG TPA: lysophospholipid acyltransferase family protein [Polyangiaceae bacterium]|nr:lysophospholipid acyltransferase family protein [Polyangiaceae bacterium]
MLSLGTLLLAAYETAKISVPTIVDALGGGADVRVCDRRLDSWSAQLLKQAGVSLQTAGLELIEPKTSYIVMSNHQSLYDIPVLFQGLKIPIRMVAKKELFRIPIMGGGMRGAGFVEIDRSNRHQAVRSLNAAREQMLRDHISLWIAPEGTRTEDGRMGEFKRGGFYMAIESGFPILPVTIDGTLAVHRSGSPSVHQGETVKVTVSPSLDPGEYGKPRVRELMTEVRRRISEHLPEAQR